MIAVVEFNAKQATDSRQILDKLFFHQTYFEQTKDGDDHFSVSKITHDFYL